MNLDIEKTLVDLVVTRAVVDKTAPDPTNLRNGWRTDALFQDIDAFIVVQCNDPAAYAEIGRQVLVKVQYLPEIAVLARLAIFRGERLLPIDSARDQTLAQMAEELLGAVSALPDGTRKMRCKSLLEYHVGVFSTACGRYDVAAKMHAASAEEAEKLGDKTGVVIGRFCEANCLLQNALKRNRTEVFGEFFVIQQRFRELEEGLRDSPLYTQWAEGNGPSAMIEACVWLDLTHSNWESWRDVFLSASVKLGGLFSLAADFVKAVDKTRTNDPDAEKELEAVASGDADNQTKATALLLLARRAMRAGNSEVAKEFVSRMPEQGAHHVCAIARRMLASK